MSSSESASGKYYSGRVILGMDTPGPDVMTIQEMEGKKPPTWDEDTRQALLERVRAKAREEATRIVAEARREAVAIKDKAHQEGLTEGYAQAQAEVDRQMREFGLTLGNILEGLQSQEPHLFEAQRQEYVGLVRLAVEKAVAVEMSERRREILGALLQEGLEKLESLRQITLRVAPADVEGMELLLQNARATFPRLEQWQVKGDASIETGGVILETRTGRVDNTTDTRFAAVMAVLDRLAGIPDPDAGTGTAAEAEADPHERS